MRNNKFDFVIGILGELIFFIPLILFCVWIKQIYPCVSGMLLLFSYKHLYKNDLEHFDKSIKCVSLTYIVILSIVFIYAGISACVPNMKNQPLLIVLIVSIVCYLNTSVGEIQLKNRESTIELEKTKNENIELKAEIIEIISDKEENKDIHKLEEDELRIYCKRKGLNSREIDIVVAKVIHHIKGENLEDYMYGLPNNYHASLRTINRDISNIKKKLNVEKI